jgi:glutamate--cysteine ligase
MELLAVLAAWDRFVPQTDLVVAPTEVLDHGATERFRPLHDAGVEVELDLHEGEHDAEHGLPRDGLPHLEGQVGLQVTPPTWTCAGSRKVGGRMEHDARAAIALQELHMPIATPVRDSVDVQGYVERICFRTGPPRVVGAELEWIVTSAVSPGTAVPVAHIQDALRDAGPFPGGSVVTFEAGGQVELSSPPANGLAACWRALDDDVRHLRRALSDVGFGLSSTAIDPSRRPDRQVADPRYDAMEAYFDRRSPVGRVMMCSTAAIQVNLAVGQDAAEVARRWRVLHAIGPAMVAAFANSPVYGGRATGWKSTRQQVWQLLDPPRTRVPTGPDPASAWTLYALDAPVMLVRNGGGGWMPDPGVTFAGWLESAGTERQRSAGHTLRPPTDDDLAYHLTTLFPPVRPRGWLEVRYIDTQPVEYWPVPLAVLTALVDIPDAGDLALAECEGVTHAWVAAARHGLDHPSLARAAQTCFTAALGALPDLGVDPALTHLVEDYLDRYVTLGRCPADDILKEGIT